MAEHALDYASRGWPVLPLWWPTKDRRCACQRPDCGNVGKHPISRLVPNGLHQASASADAVCFRWAAFPQANIGIRTGSESGVVVLDIDGEAGRKALQTLVERNGRFKAAWARTGSGGWHAYMAHPGRTVSNSAGRLGLHLDVRGDGGYVVAPPSLHASGRRYRWHLTLPEQLPPLPTWMIELLASPEPRVASPVRFSAKGLTSYVIAVVRDEARQVALAPAGQRNASLNLAAWRLGGLVGAGLVDEMSVADILLVAATVAGLGDAESRATIRSGLQAGIRHPRGVVS